MSVGYAITNQLTGLAASAFTWSSGYTTGRSRLNDGFQDELAAGSSSAQASGQYLQLDLGSAKAVCGIALLNHNLGTGGCAVTIYVDSTDDPAFPAFFDAKVASTINTAAPYNKDTILQFPADYTKRYWRIYVTHSGTKTITIGEILVFTSITTLSRSPIYGLSESERYITNRVESTVGVTRATYLAGPIRSKRFAFKDLEAETQRDELMTMWRATQGGVAKLLWVDKIESTLTSATAEGQRCLWGRLGATQGWTNNDYNLFDVDGFELVGEGREVGS